MDPITALGAVSSAIGIASFALDLSLGLFKLANQVRSAKDSLKGVGETVKSTAYALEEVERLLQQEEQHVRQGGNLRMFSAKGLSRVKETTDQCLIVLWKIEAVALAGEEPDDADLAARLERRARSVSDQQPIMLSPKFTNTSLGIWDRLVFAVSASDKLGEYGKQLQNFQISLSLIFDVVTVTYLLSKACLTDDDRIAIQTAKEDLHRPRPNYRQVAQVVLDGAKPLEKEANPLLEKTLEPKEQKSQRQTLKVSRLDPDPASIGRFGAFFSVPTGLENPSKPRMNHCSNRPAHSFASRRVVSQHIDPDGNKDENHRDRGISGANSIGPLHDRRQSSPNFQSTTTLRAGMSEYNPTPTISELSTSHQVGSLGHEAASNPVKVYSLQKHSDWRQEKLSYNEIQQRLAKLDLDPMGALDKKLKLSMKHQIQIDAIQTRVNGEETNQGDYEWSLRQLELKEKRLWGLSLGHFWGLQAIIVYLERQAQQLQTDFMATERLSTSKNVGLSSGTEGRQAMPASKKDHSEEQLYKPAPATDQLGHLPEEPASESRQDLPPHSADSVHGTQSSPSEQSRTAHWRPLAVRRPSIDPSAYDLESRRARSSPDGRQRRNSHYGARTQSTERDYQDRLQQAQRYLENIENISPATLTADTLRKTKTTRTHSHQTRSTDTRCNESYALHSRNSIDTEDIRILVKDAATLSIGSASMPVHDGAGIHSPIDTDLGTLRGKETTSDDKIRYEIRPKTMPNLATLQKCSSQEDPSKVVCPQDFDYLAEARGAMGERSGQHGVESSDTMSNLHLSDSEEDCNRAAYKRPRVPNGFLLSPVSMMRQLDSPEDDEAKETAGVPLKILDDYSTSADVTLESSNDSRIGAVASEDEGNKEPGPGATDLQQYDHDVNSKMSPFNDEKASGQLRFHLASSSNSWTKEGSASPSRLTSEPWGGDKAASNEVMVFPPHVMDLDQTSDRAPKQRRTRTSERRVKAGCNNCKQRRVKCNEQRPACSNCMRSRQICSGYPPPPRSARPYEETRIAPRALVGQAIRPVQSSIQIPARLVQRFERRLTAPQTAVKVTSILDTLDNWILFFRSFSPSTDLYRALLRDRRLIIKKQGPPVKNIHLAVNSGSITPPGPGKDTISVPFETGKHSEERPQLSLAIHERSDGSSGDTSSQSRRVTWRPATPTDNSTASGVPGSPGSAYSDIVFVSQYGLGGKPQGTSEPTSPTASIFSNASAPGEYRPWHGSGKASPGAGPVEHDESDAGRVSEPRTGFGSGGMTERHSETGYASDYGSGQRLSTITTTCGRGSDIPILPSMEPFPEGIISSKTSTISLPRDSRSEQSRQNEAPNEQNCFTRRISTRVVSDSMLDEDMIQQLMLLLTPAQTALY